MQQKYVYSISYKDKPIYFGSTKSFNKRKTDHKCYCFNVNGKEFNFRIYRAIRKLGIKQDTFFSKLTFTNLGSFSNFLEEENRLIKEHNPIGNTNCAVRDKADKNKSEYQKKYEQTEKRKQYKKDWAEVNREELLAKKREYQKKTYQQRKITSSS